MWIKDAQGALINLERAREIYADGKRLYAKFRADGSGKLICRYGNEIEAKDALEDLAKKMENAMQCILPVMQPKDPKEAKKSELLKTGIECVQLSSRSFNALYRAGVETLEDLVNMTREKCSNIRSLGKNSLEEIELMLKTRGLDFKEENYDEDNS